MKKKEDGSILLVDNGSVIPYSCLYTRAVAKKLAEKLEREVIPCSMAHSDSIDPGQLNGQPVLLLKDVIESMAREGFRNLTLMPFVLANQGAIHRRILKIFDESASAALGQCCFMTPGLLAIEDSEFSIPKLLHDRVCRTIGKNQLDRPRVLLVDHGSPRLESATQRDAIAEKLSLSLGSVVESVVPCSMERRPGPEYAFNDPLLEVALAEAGESQLEVVLARLFLTPGRHSGKGGDVDQICSGVKRKFGNLGIFESERVLGIDSAANLLIQAYHIRTLAEQLSRKE